MPAAMACWKALSWEMMLAAWDLIQRKTGDANPGKLFANELDTATTVAVAHATPQNWSRN
jgi:hypothetical protein